MKSIFRMIVGGLLSLILTSVCASAIFAQSGAAEPILCKIPAGTPVSAERVPGWSNVLLVAQSKVTQGDTEKVSAPVVGYAEMFAFVMAANVVSDETPDGPRYRLERVGIGLAAKEAKSWAIASGRSEPGAKPLDLGFLTNRVLGGMEASLDDMRVVAQHATLLMYDSKAIVLDRGRHVERTLRNVVWTDPKRGGIGSAIWLLKGTKEQAYEVVTPTGVFVPQGFFEQRELHVDSNQFTMSMPGPLAFAMVRLPAGRSFDMSPELAAAAAKLRYSRQELSEFGKLLTAALAPLRESN